MTGEPRPGTIIADRYRVDRLLGRGGMGVVYVATHRLTGREVGLKLLQHARDDTGAARMLQEARAAASLSHPHVVDVLDMGYDDGGAPYLVMEKLTGESLAERLRREGPLDPAEALRLLAPILGAVACAHDAGIVHRDIKPSNIFLCAGGAGRTAAKLLDFGVAKLHGGQELTEPGVTVGTPEYMSPEQARGQRVGPATDVWALGAVLYACLSGRSPFAGANTPDVLLKVVEARPTPLSSLDLGLDARLSATIARALAREPDGRFDDVRGLARALAGSALLAGIALPADPDPVGLPDWPRWLLDGRDASRTSPRATRAGRPATPGPVDPAGPTLPARDAGDAMRGASPDSPVGRSRTRLGWGLLALACAGLISGLLWLRGTTSTTAPAASVDDALATVPPPRAATPAAADVPDRSSSPSSAASAADGARTNDAGPTRPSGGADRADGQAPRELRRPHADARSERGATDVARRAQAAQPPTAPELPRELQAAPARPATEGPAGTSLRFKEAW